MEGKTEFAVFCIENIASALKLNAEKVYVMLAEDTDILETYIIPHCDVLHTQSRDYIVADIMDVMRRKGLKI